MTFGLRHVQPAIAPGSEDRCPEFSTGVLGMTEIPHPGILVEDLGELASRLGESGVDVQWDNGFPGHRRFRTHDCLGNRLEFLSPA